MPVFKEIHFRLKQVSLSSMYHFTSSNNFIYAINDINICLSLSLISCMWITFLYVFGVSESESGVGLTQSGRVSFLTWKKWWKLEHSWKHPEAKRLYVFRIAESKIWRYFSRRDHISFIILRKLIKTLKLFSAYIVCILRPFSHYLSMAISLQHKILPPWQTLWRSQLLRKAMCRIIRFHILFQNIHATKALVVFTTCVKKISIIQNVIDIKEKERRYQGRWHLNILSDYC